MRDNSPPSSVSLSVSNWSAWAPSVSDQTAWQNWAKEGTLLSGVVDSGGTDPDVKFVAPMMRRRLSRLSRMAFRAATDCLDGTEASPSFVFCSRYGEYARGFGILQGLSNGEAVSAAAFSMSVHNTATSLYSIETKDQSASTALAGGEATLEVGFIEAWSLLVNGAADSVLLICHDERLPDLYRDQQTTVAHDSAFAMLLRRPEDDSDGIALDLEWTAQRPDGPVKEFAVDPPLQVLQLLLAGDGSFVLDTGRLIWTWRSGLDAD